jgi:site-specific DNA-cytosine methylase
MPMKAISLFAGAGGDSLGMKMSGIDVVAFSENNADAIRTHLRNFENCQHIGSSVSGDITKIPDAEFEKYGNAIAGVFDIKLKDGNNQKLEKVMGLTSLIISSKLVQLQHKALLV